MSSFEKQRSRKRTRNLFMRCVSKALKTPERLTVSEWAERYRILDESSNFSGRWNNDITPYLVGIMDSFNDPYIQEINFCKPTQVGGTEAMLNMLGWIIMDDPAPTMIVYPDDELAKDTSNDRLKPSLTKTPEIEERFFRTASKELNLKFQGMRIYLRGSKSPGKLASKAIKYLFFDEIDKIGGATKKEASPYSLARERTRTFAYSRKIYTCSTPTLKTNYVWRIHEAADEQRHYFVPCPHCESMIELKWKQIQFASGEGLTHEERAKTAIYVCQECGCEITDKEKIKMIRNGIWKDVKGTTIGKPRKVSFWINALYSRFLTWSEIVLEFLNSKDDPEQLQNFINSWLAEPWEDTKLKTSEDTVMDRQTSDEQFIVPDWAKVLVGGVDVQETTLYYSIRAFGNHITSQNITHGQVLSWSDIESVMNAEYTNARGDPYVVRLCLIDSGYDADSTYDFCANHSDWAMPVKGASNPMMNHYKISKINKPDSRAHGINLVIVDGDKYKDMIAARMMRENGSGSWMVYAGCDMEYAQQVTSEHKVNERSGNNTIQRWRVKQSHADNHYLDTEVYAMAAADIVGMRSFHLTEETVAPAQKPASEQTSPEEQWIRANDNWIGG